MCVCLCLSISNIFHYYVVYNCGMLNNRNANETKFFPPPYHDNCIPATRCPVTNDNWQLSINFVVDSEKTLFIYCILAICLFAHIRTNFLQQDMI